MCNYDAHLDDLCICHWLFVLDIAASFQKRERYSNVLRKLQVLLDQLDEARWIKKNIEKRSRKVSYIDIINDIKENKI